MIHQRYAVEFDRRTVGIAVRMAGGFIFYSSDDRFEELDGRLFRKARAIERALERTDKRNRKAAQAAAPAFAG